MIINNTSQNPNLPTDSEIFKDMEIELLANIPYDEELSRRNIEAKSILDIKESSLAVGKIAEMMDKLKI